MTYFSLNIIIYFFCREHLSNVHYQYMEKFYNDANAVERQKEYVGKSMGEIMELEKNIFDEKKHEIDEAHEKWTKGRSEMLTVQKLIDFLKTQDPDGCVLAYESNSDAYIEQFPTLPSPDILNVAMAKKQMREDLKNWYKNAVDADKKIERDMSTVFRYAKDNDVVIRFS